MQPLLSAQEMQEVDRRTTDKIGLPEILLMEHAALGVLRSLEERFASLLPKTKGVILAGTGNNGGDALAVARLLYQKGCSALFVAVVGDKKKLSASASQQLQILGKLGIPVGREVSAELLKSCDWIVDGIFGTGLTRKVEGVQLKAIEEINRVAAIKWTVSIDIPSGLSSDTGFHLGCAVNASETVTLGFIKKGLVTGEAAEYVGKLTLCPIEIPRHVPFAVEALLYDEMDALRIPERPKSSNKGSFGHVYVWAGESEKEGASALSAFGALRSGSGLVTVLGEAGRLASLRQRLAPEIQTKEFKKDFPEKGTLIMGPGMGTGKSDWATVKQALESKCGLILDADAITLLSENRKEAETLLKNRAKSGSLTVLTPHPKEASRLLNSSVEEIQKDRYASVKALSKKYSAWILLKGKGTLIRSAEGPTVVVTRGDSGLAKGGTGDLLCGIAAAFLEQGMHPNQALPLSAFVHGRASELVSQKFGQERSTLATDIANTVMDVLKEIEEWKRRSQH